MVQSKLPQTSRSLRKFQAGEPLTDEQEKESLAESVRKVSKATERLYKSGLNRKAVIVLLADLTKLSKRNIEKLLDGLKTLEENYVEGQKGGASKDDSRRS